MALLPHRANSHRTLGQARTLPKTQNIVSAKGNTGQYDFGPAIVSFLRARTRRGNEARNLPFVSRTPDVEHVVELRIGVADIRLGQTANNVDRIYPLEDLVGPLAF